MYAFKIYDDKNDYTFMCNNRDFLEEFNSLFDKFFNEFKGEIEVVSQTKQI